MERISPDDDDQVGVVSAEPSSQQHEQIQYTIQSGAAATSLIELSQAPGVLEESSGHETILVQAGPDGHDQQAQLVDAATVVEIQGHSDVDGAAFVGGGGGARGYILVTTEDNEQRLVPVSTQQVITEEEVVEQHQHQNIEVVEHEQKIVDSEDVK